MTDGGGAFQTPHDHGVVKDLADQAEAAVGVEMLSVIGDDAGAFLTTVLKGVQAERRQDACVFGAKDTEDAALFVQFVVVAAEPLH